MHLEDLDGYQQTKRQLIFHALSLVHMDAI